MKLVAMIIIIASFLAIKFNKKIEQVIPVTVMGMVLFVYTFGLFEKLNLGIAVVKVMSMLVFIYLICQIIIGIKRKQIKTILVKIITPGFISYIIMYLLFSYINRNSIFIHHDEFSHWGLMIKNMYHNASFASNEYSIIQFNEYPPFTAIFQYMLLVLKGEYTESTVIVASNLLYLSIIISVYQKIEWKKNIKMLLIYIPITLFLPMVFYLDFYKNILVDGLLGVFVFFIIYTCFTERTLLRSVNIILGLSSLVLIKASGMGLSIMVIIIILGDIIINGKKETKQWITILLAIIAILICTTSWKIKIGNAHKEWDIQQERTIQIEENTDIIKGFIQSLFSRNVITDKKITVACIFLLLIAHFIYTIKQRRKIGKRYLYYSISLIMATILYALMLLLTYLFVIPKEEALQIVCFDRYMNTIIIAVIMFHVYIFMEKQTNLKWDSILIGICILLTILPVNSIVKKCFVDKREVTMEIEERKRNMKILEYKNQIDKEARIYYLTNKGENMSKVLNMAKYDMLPLKITNTDGMELNIEKLKGILTNGNYTYLYISKVDDNIKKQLKEVLYEKIEEETMYEINKIQQSKIQLVKVEKE